jgi:hypothetical protein
MVIYLAGRIKVVCGHSGNRKREVRNPEMMAQASRSSHRPKKQVRPLGRYRL